MRMLRSGLEHAVFEAATVPAVAAFFSLIMSTPSGLAALLNLGVDPSLYFGFNPADRFSAKLDWFWEGRVMLTKAFAFDFRIYSGA